MVQLAVATVVGEFHFSPGFHVKIVETDDGDAVSKPVNGYSVNRIELTLQYSYRRLRINIHIAHPTAQRFYASFRSWIFTSGSIRFFYRADIHNHP